ncbi:GEVED domain-containing protein, partial [Flavobacterium sp.]|uniref:GEVED domain-containing protein n=1 Tax=Flavobacterium sp. TaxID=239 RepID=UPI003753C4EF
AVNSNGWISFGSSLLSPSVNMNTTSSYTPIASISSEVTNDLVARVSAMGRDLQSQIGGEIRYQVLGNSPNQTLVIQWKNFKKFNQAGDSYNFQIRLSETTNVVDVVYGSMTSNATAGLFQCGLRANPNTSSTNYNSRTTTTDWSSSTAATNSDNTLILSQTVFPVSGLTYTWNPPLNCSGTPNPGNTLSSVSSVCNNVNFNLSLENTTVGSNVSYQWQSSTDNINFISITNAIASTLFTSQTGSTYYRCIVTCNASSETTNSNSVYVLSNSLSQCYCNPTYTNGKTDGDLISNITISGTTLSNNSGTANVNPSFTYFTGQPNYTGTLQAGSTYNINVAVGTFGFQNVAVWIDYNDNAIFETLERVGFTTASIGANGSTTFPISLACNPTTGMHRMRVRDVYNIAGISIDPCLNYLYGETEDYDINITAAAVCPQPANLNAVNITNNSADLSWTIGCVETQWDLHLTTLGGGIPTGIPSNVNVTSVFNATSLLPDTDYEFYVRANCLANGYSSWTGPFTFSTIPLPPSNDNCINSTSLIIGNVFNDNSVVTTNISATNSNPPAAGCSFYNGGDVWFSVTIPASGSVTVETKFLTGSAILDTGMAIYSGSCSSLVLVECDDDDGTGNFSLISLTGRTPGEVVYVNTFEYENNAFGNYQIAAYDCSSTTPEPTGNTTQAFCSEATIGDLYVDGTTIKWYDALTGGNLLLLTDAIVSNTTYYASQTINCESFNRIAVLAIISSAPIVNNSTLIQCDDNTNGIEIFNLTNVNSSISSLPNTTFTYFISIFDAESNTAPITNSTAYVNTINPETIFVRVENQYGCYSIAELNLSVTTTLSPTGSASQSYCNGTVASLQAVGNSVQWYDSLLSTTPLPSSTLLVDQISYFASQTQNGCESGSRLEVVYTSNCPFAGCLSDTFGQFPAVTFVPICSGIQEIITTTGYTAEYSAVTVTSGIQYSFKSSNNSTFITIANDLGTIIYTSGTGNVNWISTISGDIRFYTHLSTACDGNDTEIGRAVQCGVAPSPPINDECVDAISLIPGGVFADNPLIVSNFGATASSGVLEPSCGAYFGGDIWYSVAVPTSGNVTIQTNSTDDTVTDTVVEVYSGDCLNLTSLLCNDDTNAGFSSLSLTGLLPASTLLVRTFSYNNVEIGTYGISAFDASLSTSNFDTSNFKFYPNPVNDILTISNTDLISKVRVINLLGQEIFSKSINSTEGKIDMSSLPTGTYLVKVSSNDLVKIIKIIKQ